MGIGQDVIDVNIFSGDFQKEFRDRTGGIDDEFT